MMEKLKIVEKKNNEEVTKKKYTINDVKAK